MHLLSPAFQRHNHRRPDRRDQHRAAVLMRRGDRRGPSLSSTYAAGRNRQSAGAYPHPDQLDNRHARRARADTRSVTQVTEFTLVDIMPAIQHDPRLWIPCHSTHAIGPVAAARCFRASSLCSLRGDTAASVDANGVHQRQPRIRDGLWGFFCQGCLRNGTGNRQENAHEDVHRNRR
jgi:hypothetical protein